MKRLINNINIIKLINYLWSTVSEIEIVTVIIPGISTEQLSNKTA